MPRKKQLYRWFWGGAGFDGATEINYFVQYQKNNLSIALWIYSIPSMETAGI
jgi:hypothetical protein